MIVCGIDPGMEKLGVALLQGDTLLSSFIFQVKDMEKVMVSLSSGEWDMRFAIEKTKGQPFGSVQHVFLGNGTGSQAVAGLLEKYGYPFTCVDEWGTTLQARNLYWKIHPPRGLWRLVPLSLRVPPRPIDDLAAWAIILRGSVLPPLPKSREKR